MSTATRKGARRSRRAVGIALKDIDRDLIRRNPPRTKLAYPDDYDPFTVWGHPGPHSKVTHIDYLDRLQEWWPGKYREAFAAADLSMSHFNEWGCDGARVEQFLRHYWKEPKLKLIRIVEHCVPMIGSRTWALYYSYKRR